MIEDAVVAALANTSVAAQLQAVAANHQLYVLTPDLQVRGLGDSATLDAFEAVDYQGFVKLVADHERVHSWL